MAPRDFSLQPLDGYLVFMPYMNARYVPFHMRYGSYVTKEVAE